MNLSNAFGFVTRRRREMDLRDVANACKIFECWGPLIYELWRQLMYYRYLTRHRE
jgi:hypothetical protein